MKETTESRKTGFYIRLYLLCFNNMLPLMSATYLRLSVGVAKREHRFMPSLIKCIKPGVSQPL